MNNYLKHFQSLAIERGELWFFKPADAIKVIGSLEAVNVRILGVDAFIVTSKMTQPLMEHSVDFSGMKGAWDAAKEFLETKLHSDFVFEIIFED